MKIPDRNVSKINFEDSPDYKFCFHCKHCAITHDKQIYREGRFYCFFWKRWKDGDDLIEEHCKGFALKTCSSCAYLGFCKKRKPLEGMLYCNSWVYYTRRDTNDLFLMGRVNALLYAYNENILYSEEKFYEHMMYKFEKEERKREKERTGKKQLPENGLKEVPLLLIATDYSDGTTMQAKVPNLHEAERLCGLSYRKIPRYIHQRRYFKLYYDNRVFMVIIKLADPDHYCTEVYKTNGGERERKRFRIVRRDA